jgi:hypothetical protein
MPKFMEPSKFVRVDYVKKREPGHNYVSPDGAKGGFNPGWYYYSYRPIKFGPFANQESALKAGCEAAIARRSVES